MGDNVERTRALHGSGSSMFLEEVSVQPGCTKVGVRPRMSNPIMSNPIMSNKMWE